MSAVLQNRPDPVTSASSLGRLVAAIDTAVTAPTSDHAEAVRHVLAAHADVALPLTAAQRAGNPDRYTRHLLHADPAGRFSVMALVWRPGQRSPVHGHHTWCAYLVCQGTLREEHFAWQADRGCAMRTGAVARHAGQTLAAPAGLGAIHSLGNDSDALAVSIHVYGVRGDRIATHVNHVVRGEYC
jgi:predicted metal-dependent enzyme (double-stranded beta helix superfamily)